MKRICSALLALSCVLPQSIPLSEVSLFPQSSFLNFAVTYNSSYIIPYYGDTAKCKLTPAMAEAYADVLESLPLTTDLGNSLDTAILSATLYDAADDGYPFLFVSYISPEKHIFYTSPTMLEAIERNVSSFPDIWGYTNGQAVKDTFDEDALVDNPAYGYTDSLSLCTINGKTGFYTTETPQNIGFAPAWHRFYTLQNGKMTKIYSVAEYSAVKRSDTVVAGRIVPGIHTFLDAEKTEAPLDDYIKAGWSITEAGELYYYTVNGEYLDVSNVTADTWRTLQKIAFQKIGIEADQNDSETYLADEYTFPFVSDRFTFLPSSRVIPALRLFASGYAPDSALPFFDVSVNDEMYEAVQYLYDNNIMTGTNERTFSPNQLMTRGMVVTLLHRLAGEPESDGASFSDVESGQWYAKAVAWANQNGIVSGYGNGQFGPADTITREQLVSILYRYAEYKDYDLSGQADLSGYTDLTNTSYSYIPFAWAISHNILSQATNTTLQPKGNVNRAQMAMALYQFCTNVGN